MGSRLRSPARGFIVRIGFPIPLKENENRRALIPSDLATVASRDQLVFETGYGLPLGYEDGDYLKAGAVVADHAEVIACPIICNPKPMVGDDYFLPGKTLFGWIHAVQGRAITDLLLQRKMTAIAWEDMFEGGRHTFWRNNEISGEAAIAHAFIQWGRLPYHGQVAVIGRGNVGRGAVRALERSGCLVTVYDRRTSHLLRREIGQYDVIVNAVLWDVFRSDHLVYEEDLKRMRPGSLIIDVSCDEGMGIQTSRATTIEAPVYVHMGIMHYVVDHTPALFYRTTTEAISAAAAPFMDAIAQGDSNEVLDKATCVREGQIMDERIRRFQSRP